MIYKITYILLILLNLTCTHQKQWTVCTGKPIPENLSRMEADFTQIHLSERSVYLTGRVWAKDSQEPLPGVNIYIVKTKTVDIKAGTASDINGEFNLLSDNTFPADSLFMVFTGYHELSFSLADIIARSGKLTKPNKAR